MSKMARNKGKRGERHVIDWLQPIVDKVYTECGLKPVMLQRNTVQSDCGGSDLVGLHWLAAEVKNVENDSPGLLQDWWEQCNEQWLDGQTPILFYTRNHRPIRVRMMGHVGWHSYTAPDFGESERPEPDPGHPCLVDISSEDFELYFEVRLRYELRKKLNRKQVYKP